MMDLESRDDDIGDKPRLPVGTARRPHGGVELEVVVAVSCEHHRAGAWDAAREEFAPVGVSARHFRVPVSQVSWPVAENVNERTAPDALRDRYGP